MPLDVTEKYLRFRQARPKQFNRLRTQRFGKGIKAVIGFKNSKSHVQSIIFKRDKYNITQARAWLRKHGYKYKQKRYGR